VLTLVGLTKDEVLERLIVARGDTSGLFLWMLSGGDSLKLLEKRVSGKAAERIFRLVDSF
ncbi:hypothetical protein, partial [Streptococcus dysgalactiae]|uniref:hypothetical protein n=1 Tax=Streptococcus dysgalactiae TaxID=1334 RepID=UPI0022834EA5